MAAGRLPPGVIEAHEEVSIDADRSLPMPAPRVAARNRAVLTLSAPQRVCLNVYRFVLAAPESLDSGL